MSAVTNVEFLEAMFADLPDGASTHYWRIRKWLPERYGHRCHVIAAGRMGNICIEFEDGVRHIVSRYSVRRLRAAA